MRNKIRVLLISASWLPVIATAQIDVRVRTLPPLIKSVEIVSTRLYAAEAIRAGGSTVTGGLETTAAVNLNAPAGTNGVGITLASSNPAIAKPPAAVFVPAGATRETFAILSYPVAASETVTITASRNLPGDSKSVTLTVIPTALLSLTLDSTSVLGGAAVPAHARFSGPPPASPAVTLTVSSSDTSAATAPTTVPLPQGRTVADFTVQTKGVADPKQVTITASYGGRQQSAPLKVQETQLKQLGDTRADGSVGGGAYMVPSPITFPVFLTGAAPQGGVVVELTSSDPQKFSVPSSVTIPVSQDRALVPVTFPLSVTMGTPTITATYKGVTKTNTFTLYPPDITISSVQFVDRYSNVITRAADSQPFSVCANVHRSWNWGDPNLTLWISYLKRGPGTTSTGREWEVPAVFIGSYARDVRVCAQLPGLELGESHEVNLKADSRNVVNEGGAENNNTASATISR
jgi:hypothetical protein